MKKIILVQTEKIEMYPICLSVLYCLNEKTDLDIVLCTTNASSEIIDYCCKNDIKLRSIVTDYNKGSKGHRVLKKYLDYTNVRNKLWKFIDEEYDEESVIWVFSVVTLKYLGDKLLGYKYILHLFELMESLSYSALFPYPKVNIKRFMQKAYKVIECEYNRAHITKVWFELENTPVVLPNKPYIADGIKLSIDDNIRKQMQQMSGKKIILYQGIISPERPLDPFIKALKFLGDEYCMVIMSGSVNNLYSSEIKNLFILPYIPAPNHLAITEKAYIGILCYVANRKGYSYTSPLNSIYCAPNKVFEYAKFGIPMLGNDIPGLTRCLVDNNMGEVVSELNPEKIANAIKKIDLDYMNKRQNAFDYYVKTDLETIICDEILNL